MPGDHDTSVVGAAMFAGFVGILFKSWSKSIQPSKSQTNLKDQADYDTVSETESLNNSSYCGDDATFRPGGEMPSEHARYDEVLVYYLKHETAEWNEETTAIDARDANTPDKWIPRHPDLIRLTGKHPFNCEPPLAKLHKKGFITPNSLHFVRNHGAAPAIDWHNHKIYLGGLCPKPVALTMKKLLTLPRHSLPVTVVCCGNRRKEQNMIKQSKGFSWGAGGVSNGVWTGVRLADVLKLAGVESIDQYPPGMHIRFASEANLGGDNLPGGVYGTSVPLEKAMDPSQDIIVCFMYNGKLLSVDHGYPVRIIIPGYIGGRMIKWLTNIDLQAEISQDFYHFYDNRVLPPHVDADLSMKEGWWHKPDYICNDLCINSAIAAPDHDEILKCDLREDAAATYKVQGYAYTGGGRRIIRAEVSFDSGANWCLCTLNRVERPSRYGKYWCWCFWELDVSHKMIANAKEMVLRAFDDGTNTQPDKPTWNLMGMLNNPWFRIKIHKTVDPATGAVSVQFEHPTLAGNQPGGWMAKIKGSPALTSPGVFHPDEAGGPPAPREEGDDADKEIPKQEVAVEAAKVEARVPEVSKDGSISKEKEKETNVLTKDGKKRWTMAEVEAHSDEKAPWIVVNGNVYDCTEYVKLHPGGAASILMNAGTDTTEEFEAIHSTKAWQILEDYNIGVLITDDEPTDVGGALAPTPAPEPSPAPSALLGSKAELVALDPKKRLPFKLISREVLSEDSIFMRFALPSPQHRLGLPVGQHVLISAKENGKLVMRAYTPTSSDHDIGVIEFVIKIYYPNEAFPEGGRFSQILGNLKVGETVDFKGPIGHVTYRGKGVMDLHNVPHKVKNFVMLAGGTGITPMYAVMAAVLRDADDETKIFLIFANRTEKDILMKPELDAFVKAHGDRLKIHYILSKPHDKSTWTEGSTGYVDTKLVQSFCPSGGAGTDNFALLCGPQGFIEDACKPALLKHGYRTEDFVEF